MKKVDKITGWTDYPFTELGDIEFQPAPIRHVQVLDYDGDKYVTVGFIGMEPKVGSIVRFHPKVWGPMYRPYYDDYKGKRYEVLSLHHDEEDGHYSGHIFLAELVWNDTTQEYDKVPMKSMVHDDEVMVTSSMKRGYLYSKPQRTTCKNVVNGDKIRVAFGYDTIARYYAKRGIKVKRDRWGFTFL